MKTKWKTALKTAAGVLCALLLLNAYCYWYYNPAEYDWDESRATDTIREPGAATSRATEGFAWARIDENGYNNARVPGEDGVYILMMGSSHTEGLYVMQDEDVSSLLEAKLRENGVEGCVYNIGISAHNFMRNAANFERALDRFEPSGYVVIETPKLLFGKQTVANAMNDSFERSPWTKPVISEWLSDQPLLRTLYNQFEMLSVGEQDAEDAQDSVTEGTAELYRQYEEALTQLMRKMKATADAHNTQAIIYYHPHLLLQEDGSALPDTDEGCLKAFSAACEAAGITFLDMTDVFLEAYEQEHILPHGFINSAPGTGHMNPAGNEMAADVLCTHILEKEALV